jgi:hypothetical protein
MSTAVESPKFEIPPPGNCVGIDIQFPGMNKETRFTFQPAKEVLSACFNKRDDIVVDNNCDMNRFNFQGRKTTIAT